MTHQELMRRAIQLAVDNVKNGGGPFGAVIARNGEIIAEGVNRVTPNHDPTAHAEVQAIRAAAARLENFDLAGCSIYSSCEPCPMCLELFTGHIWTIFILLQPKRMPHAPDSTMLLFTTNCRYPFTNVNWLLTR